jgi:hypothetical protein
MIQFSMEHPVTEHVFWSPFCDLDFVLAHKVLGDPTYADELRGRHKTRILILDNSMHELGTPLSCGHIARAAELCNADYVIPPDLLGEWDKNVTWVSEMNAEKLKRNPRWNLAPVLCGTTREQRFAFLRMCAILRVGMVCLPFKEDRFSWYNEQKDYLEQEMDDCPCIHLLGVNTLAELRDFALISRTSNFHWSVDTAKAYKWGVEYKLLEHQESIRGSQVTSSDVVNTVQTPDAALRSIIQNIHTLKAACRGR